MDLGKWLSADLLLVVGGVYLAVHYLITIMRSRQSALLAHMRKQIETVAQQMTPQEPKSS